jgi:hypothetical protein
MRLPESYETSIRRTLMIMLFGVIILACQTSLYGHNLGQSYTYLKIYDDKITGRFEIILSDLNKALSTEQVREPITQANLVQRIDEVQEYVTENLKFHVNDKPLTIRFSQVDTLKAKGVVFALLDFTLIEESATPDIIDIEYAVMFDVDSTYTGMVLIEQFWRGNIFNNESRPSLVFSDSDRNQRLDLSDYSMFSGFNGIVKLGIKHIWLGIDHILFLVALILPAAMIRRERRWEPVSEFRSALFYVIKIVTLFTIAHTLTLSLASFDVVELPTRLVESVIAISITIAALDILYPIFKKKIAWVVFIFGLFHGFGFASVLSHLGVLGEHMVLSLFGFNLGVEIGQVVVILIIFPVLYQIRTYSFFPKVVMKFGAVALIMLSVVWFVERAILGSSVKKYVEASLYQLLS